MRNLKAIQIEGGIFSPDLLEQLETADLQGQKPGDFGFKDRSDMTNTVAALFSEARELWAKFQHRRNTLTEADSETTLTRQFVIGLLNLMEYQLEFNRAAYQIENTQFRISHRAGKPDFAPPVHIVPISQSLERIDSNAQPKRSPHALMQEFLNRTDALWGIVTNGETLRVLRDTSLIRKLAYLEFDLGALFEEQQFNAFMLMYRLLHRSRLPQNESDAHESLLEQYYQQAIEQGGRIRDKLREGVEQAITELANGLLANGEWKVESGQLQRKLENRWIVIAENEQHFYQQLLKLIYRLLFLFVAEERGLISPNRLYHDHYGVSRLRRLVAQPRASTHHNDLWRSLQALWHILRDPALSKYLQTTALNGELFNELKLDLALINNRNLLNAIHHLVYYRADDKTLRAVNYAALDVEELGSVYESLLELQPFWEVNTTRSPILPQDAGDRGATIRFQFQTSTERKSTGSYYTPPELVAELIDSALKPVVQRTDDILSLKILDPACGSGHFLLAAARFMGRELAKRRTQETDPSPENIREATREVISKCIYGVDKNPLAVELCKVALFIESHTGGKPLTFLDHHIRCGDSLVGVQDLHTLTNGIPDEAFSPKTGDNQSIATAAKRRNKAEREGQTVIHFDLPNNPDSELPSLVAELNTLSNDTLEQIQQKERLFHQLRNDEQWKRLKLACDLYTAAFFQPLTDANNIITTHHVRMALQGEQVPPQIVALAQTIANRNRFFHWHLEFPEVFYLSQWNPAPIPSTNITPVPPALRGNLTEGVESVPPALGETDAGGPPHDGFHVILGNPPWERVKLQQQEFFSTRSLIIANAANKAERERLICQLPQTNPELWKQYQSALHDAEATSQFLRESNRFPLTGRGDINTYSVFAELFLNLMNQTGRAGILVPTGIATDDTNKHYFAHLIQQGHLSSLYDFENRAAIFPNVHRSYRFSLLTLSSDPVRQTEFAFFLTRAEQLRDNTRRFKLTSQEIALINPNTRTCPIFRTRQDAQLTRAIYQRVPVLVNEAVDNNPWLIKFSTMFHMSNDSHLFRTREQLQAESFVLKGNRFVRCSVVYLPLYEAKMIWHYDHRYGSYEGVNDRNSTHLPTPTEEQYADPNHIIQPWYWVEEREVNARLSDWKHGWLLTFRNVTNSSNERSAVFSVIPRSAVGNSLPLMHFTCANCLLSTALIANCKCLPLDTIVKQKVAGVNMNFFYVKQFPILPPSAYSAADLLFIVPRVVELTYTAWDIQPFAEDVWNDADEALREAIAKQRTANSEWQMTEGDTFAIPPFVWNSDRRAELKSELDAYYAKLYGLNRKQLRYILDPADLTASELTDILDPAEEVQNPLDPKGYAQRVEASTFHGETFRVLKEKEIKRFGEYRTRRLVLEAWERLQSGE